MKNPFKKVIKESFGPYVAMPYCDSCGSYYNIKLARFNLMPTYVCRECGGPMKDTVGQYKVMSTKSLFSSNTEIIGFLPKVVVS
tara:strand:+ start:3339 stop:3590 length:252 start_codon:yes stop_codon:yes gene_type:complete